MKCLRWLHALWRTLFRSSALDRDAEAEIEACLDVLTDRHVEAGLAPAAARRAALLEVEGVEQTKEKVRDARIGAGVESVLSDVRLAGRSLRRDPGFAASAIVILALGIGINVTMFGAFNACRLRPLPYPDGHRLVDLDERGSGGRMKIAMANFADWQDRQRVFTGTAAYRLTRVSLSGRGDAESVEAVMGTGRLFAVLGVNPAAGRWFTNEEAETRAPVAVIGDLLWRRRYGERPMVGETVTLDGAARTVIGVMPPGFAFPDRAQVWVPAAVSRANTARASHAWSGVARLRDGRTLTQARDDMARIGAQLAREYPDFDAKIEPVVTPLRDAMIEPEITAGMTTGMAAAAFVLLIACVNIATLVLARGAARGREMALRSALGAGRWRLLRHSLAESFVLAAFGAAGGLALGRLGLLGVNAAVGNAPVWLRFDMDLTVITFTVALLFVTAAAFGLVPAWRASGGDPRAGLTESHGCTASPRAGNLRHGLVVVQVAVATLLLVCAGLMARAFLHVLALERGFRAEGVVTMQVTAPRAAYPDQAACTAFFDGLLDAVRAVPGVVVAGAGTWLPSQQANWVPGIVPEETVASSKRGRFPATAVAVAPGYFESLRIARLQGRTFTPRDGLPGTPRVVIVNRGFVERHWPQGDPIGRRLKLWQGPGDVSDWLTVVGVVDDVLGGPGNAPITTYFPMAQEGSRRLTLTVQTASDPMAIVPAIRQRLARIDRDVPLAEIATMEAVVDGLHWWPRMLMRVFGIIGGVALALAAAGVYGVLAYSVSRRTREIGVRTALGATQGQIAGLVMRQGLALAAVGIVIGLGLSIPGTRLLRGLLAGVSPTDPWAFGVTTAVLLAAALLACYLPARRARRLDPLAALRCE